MNKKFLVIIAFIFSTHTLLWAQVNNQGNQQQSQSNSYAIFCADQITKLKEKQEKDPKIQPTEVDQNCLALDYTAKKNGESLHSQRESTSTLDKSITCDMRAGYTLDYDACVNTIRTYDALKILEQGMFTAQNNEMKATDQQINNQTQQTIQATGDVTGATLDAQKDKTLKAKQLNEQQAASYSAATLALVAAINAWPSADESGLYSLCKGADRKPTKDQAGDTASNCMQQLNRAYKDQSKAIFANKNARNAFKTAAIQFATKGGQALIEAIRLGLQAEQIKKVKDAAATTEDDQPNFHPCLTDPTLPGCNQNTSGDRVSGGNFGTGGVGFTSDGSSNSFNSNGETSTFGEAGAATNIKDHAGSSDVTSPFGSNASQANDILNPAAAATLTPGNGGGGGGGGGGGAPGGGGASLGSDLEGVDKNADKEKDIKTSEVSGGYSQGGGGGFQAVKGSKDDFNPFKSLLDTNSSGGGITEDRSIASENGKPITLGLFERLKSRYGEAIKSDKITPKYDD